MKYKATPNIKHDERTPGAPTSVELVDERGSNPTTDPSSTTP
jgi:hypothetical protein